MAFIRLSDDYIDNPKFNSLSDGAFRLWHESLAHCRRHLTDGLFNFATMRGFPRYTRLREKQLSTPHIEGASPLWELVPKFGYKLHDYLAWNLSKEEESADRDAAKARMRKLRTGRKGADVRPNVRPNIDRTSTVTNAFVLGTGMGSSSSDQNVVTPKAAQLNSGSFTDESDADPSLLETSPEERFIHETIPTVYAKVRHGALAPRFRPMDFPVVRDLVARYGDHLADMYELFLLYDPKKKILNQPGTVNQFAHTAPICETALREAGRW